MPEQSLSKPGQAWAILTCPHDVEPHFGSVLAKLSLPDLMCYLLLLLQATQGYDELGQGNLLLFSLPEPITPRNLVICLPLSDCFQILFESARYVPIYSPNSVLANKSLYWPTILVWLIQQDAHQRCNFPLLILTSIIVTRIKKYINS